MFKKKKEDKFLVLDIGTEAVKALIFKKELSGGSDNNFLLAGKKFRNIVLGHSVQYFEKYGVFNSNDFENDIFKNAILKALNEAYRNFIFFSEKKDKKSKEQDWTKFPVIVNLPPSAFKARIFSVSLPRKCSGRLEISKEEEKNICQQVFREAREKISLKFSEECGILPTEIEWTALKIVQTKIDGYLVSGLSGYEGKNLSIKILAVFLPKNYFEKINKISRELKLNILKVVHMAEVLPFIFKGGETDGIFVDVGGEISQIFLARAGFLEKIDELKVGGKIFSRQLADDLGIDEETARNLKEEYSKNLLSQNSAKRIKEILRPARKIWYQCLKDKVKEISPEEFSSPNIFLFGGGSLLPEIKEALKENQIIGLNDFPVSQPFNVNFIEPGVLNNIEDATDSLKSPKDVPILLLA
jgi:cell division ATPase FtsA